MFQKYIVKLVQSGKLLLFPLSILMLIFFICNITLANVPAKITDAIVANTLREHQPVMIIKALGLFYGGVGMWFVFAAAMLSLIIVNNKRRRNKKKILEQQLVITQMQAHDECNKIRIAQLSAEITQQDIALENSKELIRKQQDELSIMKAVMKKDSAGEFPVLAEFVDFEAFSKVYPDKDAILKYIAGLKWNNGYSCIRCCNDTFLAGQTPFGRRCTKCGYDESATVNTIFHNSKILINKALYMLVLVYNTKGTISSHKLAKLLDIRQSTCWVYSSRFKKKLLQSKIGYSKVDDEGWSKMVLDTFV